MVLKETHDALKSRVSALEQKVSFLQNNESVLRQKLEKMELFETVINYNPAIASITKNDKQWSQIFISESVRQYGYTPEDFYNRTITPFDLMHPDDRSRIIEEDRYYEREKITEYEFEYRIITKDGRERWILDNSRDILDENGEQLYTISIELDITAQKVAEVERERLIAELQKALNEVKTLQGLIPICAHCKKIRDDGGYWQQLEEYFTDRSKVEFSHAFCPECLEKLYPEEKT